MHHPPQQWISPHGYAPAPLLSTRGLTVTKWITVVLSALLTGLAVVWVMQLRRNVRFLENYRSALDDPEAAIANSERIVVVGMVTLAAVALLGVVALVAGTGQQWARLLCILLLLGPMGVIGYGAFENGAKDVWALSLVTPFIALAVLWCLPWVDRGIAAKRAGRAARARSAPMGRLR